MWHTQGEPGLLKGELFFLKDKMAGMHVPLVGSVLPGLQEEERVPRFTGAMPDGTGRAKEARWRPQCLLLRAV